VLGAVPTALRHHVIWCASQHIGEKLETA